MKNSLLALSFLFCHTSHAAFDDWSLMAAAGGTNAQFHVSQSLTAYLDPANFDPIMPNNDTLSALSPAGYLGIGYAKIFKHDFLLGATLTAGYTRDTVSDQPALIVSSGANIILSSNLHAKFTNDFALLFKPGYIWENNTLFYVLFGPRWGNFETSLESDFVFTIPPTFDGALSHQESGYHLGFTAGLGIEQQLTEHFSVGLEYAYTHYDNVYNQNITADIFLSGVPIPDSYLHDSTEIDALTNTVMLTFTYR